MRIFAALDLEDGVRKRIVRFENEMKELAPDATWVRPESLHITLKFFGECPQTRVDEIRKSLGAVEAQAFHVHFAGSGFFPDTKSARAFWIGIVPCPALDALAKAVDRATAELTSNPDTHSFRPHLTLARSKGRSGAPRRQGGDRANKKFEKVQAALGKLSVDFGIMPVKEFFLVQSHLGAGGSKYEKIAAYPLNQ